MKLKSVPKNTIVHTPTEEEANELLAILHENGYSVTTNIKEIKWVNSYKDDEICFNIDDEKWGHCTREWYEKKSYTILTLAEFKERYGEEEKPQPKFKRGDKVMIDGVINPSLNRHVGSILELPNIDHPSTYTVRVADGYAFLEEVYLTTYTEPETKPTENMETKELNLCELLKGHEEKEFYSPYYGVMELMAISDGLLCFQNSNIGIDLLPNGHSQCSVDGYCAIFPSKALYEQYPLEPYTAWMKWQEEQHKCKMYLMIDNECNENIYEDSFIFRTPADRDKCIEEIKAIIEKYSKK